MTWNTNRSTQLPKDWRQRRLAVFARDSHRCTDCGWTDPTDTTLECDHIGPPLDHRLENLATRCGKRAPNNCHGKKTAGAAAAARSTKRPTERHPGLLP